VQREGSLERFAPAKGALDLSLSLRERAAHAR
jgi:hypothetical protein